MDRVGSAESILFEGFRLDRRGGVLFRLDPGDVATPVALGSRALNLLRLLVERKGELVSAVSSAFVMSSKAACDGRTIGFG